MNRAALFFWRRDAGGGEAEREPLWSPSQFHVNQPTPAIVAQSAVRRLPRAALLLFCAIYILAGFIGREPWKNSDITAFGYMIEMAQGHSAWFDPRLLGRPPEIDALLPYWLGAWALELAPSWLSATFAARVPFAVLLALTLSATWYGVYYLARSPAAQPVAFAFGGEARPADYARALADGGLLALIACLGLAQLSHEITPAAAQSCFTAITFFAFAALPYRTRIPAIALVAGLLGLSLSGAPILAILFGIGGAAVCLFANPPEQTYDTGFSSDARPRNGRGRRWAWATLAITAACAAIAYGLDLYRWRIESPVRWVEWRNIVRLFLWFAWPVWPLTIWSLWSWRRQLKSRLPDRHLALPLWFIIVGVGTTIFTPASDRSLLLTLPAMATLGAFALPTLGRTMAALIDWFTLLFFSGCALLIWVIWLSLQTGFPTKPLGAVARLGPGFVHEFSLIPFVAAVVATAMWVWLVSWRVGRHPSAIWKSLVLPAGGAGLCWLLLTTLWLAPLDYARSYVPLVRNVMARMDAPGCIEVHGLTRAQTAAFMIHGKSPLQPAGSVATCPWLLADSQALPTLRYAVDMQQWALLASVRRPTDTNEDILLFRRTP